MGSTHSSSVRAYLFLLLGLVLGAGGLAAFAFFFLGLPGPHAAGQHQREAPPAPDVRTRTVELVEGKPNTLFVPKDVRDALGVGESLTAEPPTRARARTLPGSTALDPTRMMHIRTRFNSEVIDILPPKKRPLVGPPLPPEMEDRSTDPLEAAGADRRELRSGDDVWPGEVLAVLWSVDVGGKKSDLMDALIQLRLDEDRLKRRTELWKSGSIPEDTLNQTRRDVVADQSAVDRAERTLRTWSIPEKEIQAVYDEARAAYKGLEGGVHRDKEKEKLWARSELIAPIGGTIVERNISKGEFLADPTANLLTIAEVGKMLIQVNAPEEDLPALLKAQKEGKPWKIRTIGLDEEATAPIDEITYIVDPNLHAAVVKGYIDNPNKKLRAGQLVTASVPLPPPPNVAEVPLTALVEEGDKSYLFVLENPTRHHYTLRRVVVTHRFDKVAWVRSKLKPEEDALNQEAKDPDELPRRALHPGERFLANGALELRSALDDLQSQVREGKH
jgi:cobalt-zinc-cadmium efflux system membrane fusion protein